eukprot:scaffold2377_cov376-Prasinococcus_capsulatus_cf.AAC.13
MAAPCIGRTLPAPRSRLCQLGLRTLLRQKPRELDQVARRVAHDEGLVAHARVQEGLPDDDRRRGRGLRHLLEPRVDRVQLAHRGCVVRRPRWRRVHGDGQHERVSLQPPARRRRWLHGLRGAHAAHNRDAAGAPRLRAHAVDVGHLLLQRQPERAAAEA